MYVARGSTREEIKRKMMIHIVKYHKEELILCNTEVKNMISRRLNNNIKSLRFVTA